MVGSDSDSDSDDMHDFGDDNDGLQSLRNMFKRMSLSEYSTSFSGIDCPGTALNQMMADLNMKINRRRRRTIVQRAKLTERNVHRTMKHKFGIEWQAHSQRELLRHPSKPACLFGDIAGFAAPVVREQLKSLVNNDQLQSVLLPLVTAENSNAVRTFLGLIKLQTLKTIKDNTEKS